MFRRFCKVKGDPAKARMLERVYDGLDGGIKNNIWLTHEHLWQHYSPGKGTFECGPSWWLHYDTRTDSPGFFVGFFGWLPFLEPFLHKAYRKTLLSICKKQRNDGCFPIYPKHGTYKTEGSRIVSWGMQKYKVDDYIDGHLVAVICMCEDILFGRDAAFGRTQLPRLRKAMQYASSRKFKNGLMQVGYGGAFIELWFSFEGYPSSSQIFYMRALGLLAEVEKFLDHPEGAEKWLSLIPPVKNGLPRLMTKAGYFINAVDRQGKKHGDGSDYFESIPNVIAGPLEIIDEGMTGKIVTKIKSIPQLDKYTPIAVNYPGRTEPFHPNVEKRGVGTHWNGGAWMGFGGFEVWTHLIARDFTKAERLINQMLEIRDKFGLQDFVAGFGAHHGGNVFNRKPCDHPITFQHGAFGNTLRGLLNVQPAWNGIRIKPRIFPEIKTISFQKPLYYGKRELYVTVNNGRRIAKVLVNGKMVKPLSDEEVFFEADSLPEGRCNLRIDMQ